ncbi:MAG: chemotaxis protein CheW [Candidatus Omnitrophica bacterium]|nr:chemotaxis protein CheW [Candidatus Omnitrophota bacterium]
MEFDAELLKEFLNESWDNIEKMDNDFVELEKNSEDPEIITRIFRVIHTMKGCSGLLGFGKLEKISHYSEDILSQVREGSRKVDPPRITKLLEAADALKEILYQVEETSGEGDGDYSQLIEELRQIAASSDGSAVKAPPPATVQSSSPAETKAPADVGEANWQVTIRIDENEKMPTIRGLVVVERLAELGTVIEAIPDVRKDEELATNESLVVFLKSEMTAAEIETKAMLSSVVSVELEQLAEGQADEASEPEESGEVESAHAEHSESPAQSASAKSKVLTERVESSIRVDIDLIDKLMNLVGELVLSRNQIAQFANTFDNNLFTSATHRLNLVTTELQEGIMKTRMQPIANVFNRYPRMIRDLATDFGKQVDLRIEGKETELDRTLIEAIKDPMVHIIRNSMDHGIETPEKRIEAGKNPVGSMEIRAFHEGGQVNIVIRDDGAGINIPKVKALAIKKDLISQQHADSMSDRDAANLVFMAGFSTAEKVTAVSGRGVGMDVVRNNIEGIGGSIDLQSEMGKGTTITVKIPLTLAIIPALMVDNAGHTFAIPQVNLTELVCLEGNEIQKRIEMVRNVEVFRLRGELLPIVRLADVLDLPKRPNSEIDFLYIVVLSSGKGQIGLVVDQVFDTEEIVVKPLSKHLKHLAAYAGASILGDGSVALILDVQGIVESAGIEFDLDLEEARNAEANALDNLAKDDQQDILLFSIGSQDQYAIPLGLVNRLEEFDRSKVEVVSGREVVQYRGDILPLVHPEHFLSVSEMPEQKGLLSVIVFSFEEKFVGLIVNEILDIQQVRADFSQASVSEGGVLGNAIVNGKTTEFLDVYQLIEMALPSLVRKNSNTPQGTGRRVLVVDDSPFYRTMIVSYLHSAGFEAVEAEHGEEALQKMERIAVDLVLTDLEMPVMDGFELLENLNEQEVYKDIPTVVLTTVDQDSTRERARQLGVDSYLIKVDREELIHTVDRALKERVKS